MSRVTKVGLRTSDTRQPSEAHHPETTYLTATCSCEACSAFTRVAARTLAQSPICDQLHRRLQPFRRLHDCSGCFRLERLPGGPCTHWKAPPSHGAHVERTFRVTRVNRHGWREAIKRPVKLAEWRGLYSSGSAALRTRLTPPNAGVLWPLFARSVEALSQPTKCELPQEQI
jgi:hypothetical protein